MTIIEFHTLTSAQIDNLLALMHELDPEITMTAEMLELAANAPETHLFVAVENRIPSLPKGRAHRLGISSGLHGEGGLRWT